MGMLTEKLTERELAAELKRVPKTLARWRRLSVGPPATYILGRPIYDRNDVETWLAGQSRKRGAA